MNTVLGVDPGSVVTGYAVIKEAGPSQDSSYELIESGIISKMPKEMPKRCYTIFKTLSKVIEEHKITSIAVEAQFVSKNPSSALKLSMVKGAIYVLAGKYDIELYEYSPKKAKIALTGNGAASKEAMICMAARIMNIDETTLTSDAADAIGIAICHLHASTYSPLF